MAVFDEVGDLVARQTDRQTDRRKGRETRPTDRQRQRAKGELVNRKAEPEDKE